MEAMILFRTALPKTAPSLVSVQDLANHSSPQGESPSQDGTDGDAGNGNGNKRKLPCNGADRGCVASWGPDHLAGNGADFLLVLSSRTSKELRRAE